MLYITISRRHPYRRILPHPGTLCTPHAAKNVCFCWKKGYDPAQLPGHELPALPALKGIRIAWKKIGILLIFVALGLVTASILHEISGGFDPSFGFGILFLFAGFGFYFAGKIKDTDGNSEKVKLMSDETELLNRCRDGDPNAFRILVNREKGMAWSVTAGLLSSPDLRSEAVATGLYQSLERTVHIQRAVLFSYMAGAYCNQ